MNFKKLSRVSGPILIEGETGTGKTQLAKLIHNAAGEEKSNFIQLNIAAISEGLFESELFGHVRGAFSGALESKKGFCEVVGSGTLFLDEIGELSLAKQAVLLTLIDEGLYYKVGSAQPMYFRGKLIFATNKDLNQMVLEQKFRADLYYRLRFHHIYLSPLRARDFNTEFWQMFNDTKVTRKCYNVRCRQDVVEKLAGYRWPGNWRELKNTIEYFFDMNVDEITLSDIPSWIEKDDQNLSMTSNNYKIALENFEKNFLIHHLKLNSGKINQTSLKTGINKVTLISKLKKYMIDRKNYSENNIGYVNGF